MANVKNNASSQETRRKLIDAAGQVFADRGLYAATLKEITDRAGVNPASVNYHFSDKFELYAAVIRFALSQTPCILPEDQATGSPEDRLRRFVTRLIKDFHDPTRPAWRITLISHEMSQPTAAVDAVMDELILPRIRHVNQLIRDILGPRASAEDISHGAFSVAAQFIHYLHSSGLLRRIDPEFVGPHSADKLAAHIVEFSLSGLYAMRAQRSKGRRRRKRRAE